MITIDTPIGPFTMTGDGTKVTGAVFGPASTQWLPAAGPVPDSAIKAVRSYFEGDITALDQVPVAQQGTAYLERCWQELRRLTEPITYRELALRTGRPQAIRAAAQGCARNRIALLVPCHRVLRSDGTLGGYRWGLDVKRFLLRHEAASSTIHRDVM